MKKRGKFEGEEVAEVECRAGGWVGDGRLNETLKAGERVVLVGEATVKRVEHFENDGRLIRRQHLKLTDGFVVTDEVDADDLIQKLRAEREEQLDELLGKQKLDGFDQASE